MKTLDPQGYGTRPRIVAEPGGRATILWVKNAPFSFEEGTVVASTHAPGGAWSEPRSVAAEGLPLPGVEYSPIAVTRAGESIAVWVADGTNGEGTAILSASRRRRQVWSEPTQVIASPPGPLSGAYGLQLALASDGKAFAVWWSFSGTRWVIKAATRPAAGLES